MSRPTLAAPDELLETLQRALPVLVISSQELGFSDQKWWHQSLAEVFSQNENLPLGCAAFAAELQQVVAELFPPYMSRKDWLESAITDTATWIRETRIREHPLS